MTRRASRLLRSVVNLSIVGLVILAARQILSLNPPRVQPRIADPAPLARGEMLPDVFLRDLQSTSESDSLVSIRELAPGQCHVLNLFDSGCAACQKAAPSWAHTGVLKEGGIRFPIFWLAAQPQDTGAIRYVRDNNLSGKLYQFRSLDDALALRQVRIPASIVVDAHQRIIGYRGYLVQDSVQDPSLSPYLREVCPPSQWID